MTRSDRNTGAYRAYRGSGPQRVRPSRSRTDFLREEGKPCHGRHSGTPFLHRRAVRNALHRIKTRQDRDEPIGPRPHPTKKGPGRY